MSSLSLRSPDAEWDVLLKAHPLDHDDIAAFIKRQLDSQMSFRGEPRASTLRPNFLLAEEIERDRIMARAVVKALLSARRKVMEDRALAKHYLGTWLDSFEELLRLEPGYPENAMFARIDTLPTANGPKVIEFNGTPAFIPDANRLSKLFSELARRIEFDRVWEMKPISAFDGLREVVLRTFRAYGGEGDPRLIFVLPREAKVFESVVQCMIDDMEKSGISACMSDPGELVFDGKTLRHKGEPVGMLIRAFTGEMVHLLRDRMRGLLAALRANAVCMFASFQSSLLSHKALFAMITDKALDLGLDAETRAIVQSHVPWTRVLVEGQTRGPDGEVIELLPFAIAEQRYLVNKPVTGHGGQGVVLGSLMDKEQWRDCLLQRAKEGGFLLQQRAETINKPHPSLSLGMPDVALYRDQGIFVADGELCGYLSRLSPTPITNVALGASVVPNFGVSPKT